MSNFMKFSWSENDDVLEVVCRITPKYRVTYEREAIKRHWPLADKAPEGALTWIAWRIARDQGLTQGTYEAFLDTLEDPIQCDAEGVPIDVEEDEDDELLDPTHTGATSETL